MNEILEKEQEITVEEKNHTQIRSNIEMNAKFNRTDPLIDEFKSEISSANNTDSHSDLMQNLNKASLGPGIILRNMREEAKLTQEDVAKELRLAVRHIEYLENDYFEKFTAVAFYIGYVRNYSKLLNLDPDKMIAKFHAVYKVKPEKAQSKLVQIKSWKDSWPMNLFFSNNASMVEKDKNIKYAIVTVVMTLIFGLIWWFVSSQPVAKSTDISKLKPSEVDELLPTSPVFVENKSDANKDNLKTAVNSDNNKLVKKNKLDQYS